MTCGFAPKCEKGARNTHFEKASRKFGPNSPDKDTDKKKVQQKLNHVSKKRHEDKNGVAYVTF